MATVPVLVGSKEATSIARSARHRDKGGLCYRDSHLSVGECGFTNWPEPRPTAALED